MESIIHHKSVIEEFRKYTEVETKGVNWFDDDNDDRITKTTVNTLINNDEFKKAMSNNEEVTVFRDTLVVSEDTEKNTVTIKRYVFSKALVQVKNLKRRQFKMIRREMFSLTINKYNGEYSVYKKSGKGRKQNILVRKNISNSNTRGVICQITDYSNNQDLIIALEKFYNSLGYYIMVSHGDLIRHFFNQTPNICHNQTGLMLFPFLNYARKNRIFIQDYYMCFVFERLFTKNKKKYHGTSANRYIADHLKINDMRVIDSGLFHLIDKNKWIDANTKTTTQDPRFTFKSLNSMVLKLQDHFILQDPDVLLTNRFDDINGSAYDHIPSYIFDIIKLYNLNYVDIMQYMDNGSLMSYIDMLYNFKQFGVKLKINRIDKIKDPVYSKIFDALCISRNRTGTFIINKEFINRVNKYTPKNHTTSFVYRKPIYGQNRYNDDEFSFASNSKNEYDNNINTLSVFVSFVPNKTKEITGGIMFGKRTHSSSIRTNQNYSEENIYTKLNQALNFNKNGILDILDIKQVYSKEYFEKTCIGKFKINPSMYIDYIN